MPESWWEHVTRMTNRAPQQEIAAAAGVDPSQVSRWSKGRHPDAGPVVRFAKSVGESPIAALIAAGYLSPDDVGDIVELAPSTSELSNDALLDEIRNRLIRSERRGDVPDDAQGWPSEFFPGEPGPGQGPGVPGGKHGEQRSQFRG